MKRVSIRLMHSHRLFCLINAQFCMCVCVYLSMFISTSSIARHMDELLHLIVFDCLLVRCSLIIEVKLGYRVTILVIEKLQTIAFQ